MTVEMVRTEGIGSWTPPHHRWVSDVDVEQYLAATNSRSRSRTVAPPVFVYVVAQGAISEAMLAIAGNVPRNQMLNGEMAFTFHRMCVPGQLYRSRACPRRLENRGRGAALLVEARIEDQEGREVSTIVQTAYLVGIRVPQPLGAVIPDDVGPTPGGTTRTVTSRIETDQPARFTAATGEDNPIHRDPVAARAVGLPGIIVHGTCVLAIVTDSLATALEPVPASIRQLRARFTSPVTPGQDLSTSVQSAGRDRWTFSTADASGRTVLSNGLVTFGRRTGALE